MLGAGGGPDPSSLPIIGGGGRHEFNRARGDAAPGTRRPREDGAPISGIREQFALAYSSFAMPRAAPLLAKDLPGSAFAGPPLSGASPPEAEPPGLGLHAPSDAEVLAMTGGGAAAPQEEAAAAHQEAAAYPEEAEKEQPLAAKQRQAARSTIDAPRVPLVPTWQRARVCAMAHMPGDWFERHFGFEEDGEASVKDHTYVENGILYSRKNGRKYAVGEFTTPSLEELRSEVRDRLQDTAAVDEAKLKGTTGVRNVIGDVADYHCKEENRYAVFQVASQLNCLEFISSDVTPEMGITRYIRDRTQGPCCAIACAAGTLYRNYPAVVPAEGPVSLKAAVASIMADTFFCATSRELDKVTLEIRRIVSAAKSWPEYLWLVYIGRKTYSLDAVCALLEGPHRLKYDRGYTIDPDALDHLLDNTSLGDGILHGESKIELRMRIIAVRDLLHSLPRGFLDGAPDDLAQTARVLLKTSEKKPGTPVTFSMTETAARQWPSMTTTDRLWHFFMSIGGTSHFHAWQMCLDCPDVICDASQMRAVGPSCYSYLRLAYPAVEFPATWSSAQGQDLGVRLIDHLRTRPELQGLEFPGPTLSFNNTEHWTCESVKATKALHNDGLLIRVGEIRHVLQGGALAVPASGKFRTRRFRTGLAAPDPSSMSGSLMYAPRTTSHAPLMKKSVVGEPPAKRQASLLAFGAVPLDKLRGAAAQGPHWAKSHINLSSGSECRVGVGISQTAGARAEAVRKIRDDPHIKAAVQKKLMEKALPDANALLPHVDRLNRGRGPEASTRRSCAFLQELLGERLPGEGASGRPRSPRRAGSAALERAAERPRDGAAIAAGKPRGPCPASTGRPLGKGTGAALNPKGSRSRPHLFAKDSNDAMPGDRFKVRTLPCLRAQMANMYSHTPEPDEGVVADYVPVTDRNNIIRNGQTATCQIECLRDIAAELENNRHGYLRVKGGYTLATNQGLADLNKRLIEGLDEEGKDRLRGKLRIGVQRNVEVTSRSWGGQMVNDPDQLVTQVFGSACSVSYSGNHVDLWEPMARLVLEASYEATLWVAVLSALRSPGREASRCVFLTALGGGSFGNRMEWVQHAIQRAIYIVCGQNNLALQINLVSYQQPVERAFDSLVRANGLEQCEIGVATLVGKTMPHSLVTGKTEGPAQALVVCVGGWQCLNTYGPPTAAGRRALLDTANAVFVQCGGRRLPWFWGGDFNDEPAESACEAVVVHNGGVVLPGCEDGTRWRGRRKVDWFATNARECVDDMRALPLVTSDHMVLSTALRTQIRVDRRIGKLRVTPSWKKPKGVDADSSGEENQDTFQVRKARRWLARAKEALRQRAAVGDAWGSTEEQRQLWRRVQRGPGKGSLRELENRIHKAEAALQAVEEAQRQDRLQEWRDRMRGGIQEVSAWLRGQKEMATTPTITWRGTPRETLEEVTEAIRQHWQEVWAPQAASGAEQRRREAIDLMAAEYERDPHAVEWRDPTQQEVRRALGQAKGSSSVDGWSGPEVRYMPAAVADLFRMTAIHWQTAGKVPEVLKETRQANLPKPGKVQAGRLEAGDARPINVECVWWRVWASAWVKSAPAAEWRRHNIPEDVLGGAGSKGAEEAAADIADNLAQQGSTIYMDHRTWSATTAVEVVGRVAIWHRWSARAGLRENPRKIQLVARGRAEEAALRAQADRQGLGDKVVPAMEALGVVTVGAQGRVMHVKDQEERRRMPHGGGTLAADVVIGCRQVATMRRRLRRRDDSRWYTSWYRKRGTLVAEVRCWLRNMGWQEEASAWNWYHPGTGMELDLQERPAWEEVEKDVHARQMHQVREGWRWWNWQQFKRQRRRDVAPLQGVEYDEARVKLAREAARDGAGMRMHVMCGSFLSPLAAKAAGGGKFDEACHCVWPGCYTDLPDQDHIMWGDARRFQGRAHRAVAVRDHLQFAQGAYDAAVEENVAEGILPEVPELESKAEMNLSMGRAAEPCDSEAPSGGP
ncbi:unnamed protein product [Prorocentrum cordatum]|uniref:Uncharacterized protein n=1 Tax=Prorocentrum cordatum TaxID=2364126 RepID=A0ABN9PDV0_9DINO|nr:unnamed protein product [Polarella glacialis]